MSDFIHQPRADETFIRSDANGFRSVAVVTLKASPTIYEAGTPLVAEHVASDPEAPAVLDQPTGLYVRAAGSGIENIGASERRVAFLPARTNATAGDTKVAVVARQAEIEDRNTDLADLSTAEADAFAAAAEAQTLIVR
jgi:hypothetical protein